MFRIFEMAAALAAMDGIFGTALAEMDATTLLLGACALALVATKLGSFRETLLATVEAERGRDPNTARTPTRVETRGRVKTRGREWLETHGGLPPSLPPWPLMENVACVLGSCTKVMRWVFWLLVGACAVLKLLIALTPAAERAAAGGVERRAQAEVAARGARDAAAAAAPSDGFNRTDVPGVDAACAIAPPHRGRRG